MKVTHSCCSNIKPKKSKNISMRCCKNIDCILSTKVQSGGENGCRFTLGPQENKHKKTIIWILMNCSFTNEFKTDPTINNVKMISEKNEKSNWSVINISPIRASNSNNFKKIVCEIDRENHEALDKITEENCNEISELFNNKQKDGKKNYSICLAFGGSSGISKNPSVAWTKYMKCSFTQIIKTIKEHEKTNQIEWKCISRIKDGHPRHPSQQSLNNYKPIEKIKLQEFDIEDYLTKFQIELN